MMCLSTQLERKVTLVNENGPWRRFRQGDELGTLTLTMMGWIM